MLAFDANSIILNQMPKNLTAKLKIDEVTLRESVGERIALLRTSLGKRAADWMVDYPEFITSRGKLSNWEHGKVFPPMLFMIRLCEDYKLTLDWFYREGEMFDDDIGPHQSRVRAASLRGR